MAPFWGPGKVKKRDWVQVVRDAKVAQKESAELRRQVSRNLMSPARATDKQISSEMVRIDRQLVHLEKLRGQVDQNHQVYGSIKAETGRLREKRREVRMLQKAKKRGVRV
ncbi:MAG: hypothetical protein WAN74_00705 [Thermoplasmata archaeon]